MKQNTIIQLQSESIRSYETYAPMTTELIKDIRSKQHDFNNQINAIHMLPYTHKDYDSLSNAVTSYSSQLAKEFNTTKLLQINLPVVSGFIFGKIKEAEYSNKKINICIKNPVLATIVPEYDLIKILGILIDNALEAIKENDTINLTLDSINTQIIIVISNASRFIDAELRKKLFTKGYTTKKHTTKPGQHGLGLPNLMELTDFYNGKIYIDNLDIDGKNHVEFRVEV